MTMTHNTPTNTISRTTIPNTKFNGVVEWVNGTKIWHKNGLWHRDDNLPACEYDDGVKIWYINGKNANSYWYETDRYFGL